MSNQELHLETPQAQPEHFPMYAEQWEPAATSVFEIRSEMRAIKRGVEQYGNRYWNQPELAAKRAELDARNAEILANHPYAEHHVGQAPIEASSNAHVQDAKDQLTVAWKRGNVHELGNLEFEQLATTIRAIGAYGGQVAQEFSFTPDKLEGATQQMRAVIARRADASDPTSMAALLSTTKYDELPELTEKLMPRGQLADEAAENTEATWNPDETQDLETRRRLKLAFSTRLKYLWKDVVSEGESSAYFRTDSVDSPTFMIAALSLAAMYSKAKEGSPEKTEADSALDALYHELKKAGDKTVLVEPESHLRLELAQGVGEAAVQLTAETEDHELVLISA